MKHSKTFYTIRTAAVAVIVLAGALGYHFTEDSAASLTDSGLTVTYLDVGQGDATVLQCGGETLLIDGGNNKVEHHLVESLQALGVTELNTIVCTHPHADHCGGLDAAADAFPFDTVYSPVETYDSATFRDFADTVASHGGAITIPQVGDTFTVGTAIVTVLGPCWDTLPENVNNWSIVLRVDYGKTSFLFTGDAEYQEENDILDHGADVKCDVFQAGHHGSSTSNSYRLLYEAQPQYAVISCGKGNSYGHPHEETLSRFRDADVTTYCTMDEGNVTFYSDGSTVSTQNTAFDMDAWSNAA